MTKGEEIVQDYYKVIYERYQKGETYSYIKMDQDLLSQMINDGIDKAFNDGYHDALDDHGIDEDGF
jgi:hypothetical protein